MDFNTVHAHQVLLVDNMPDHINKKTIGILVITLSLFTWMLNRMTQYVSILLGKVMCEEHYMHVSGGMTDDLSCGFNIEMHLTYSLFSVLILGIVLYISSRKEVE